MGKGRFTALDVSAMTTSLQEILIGTRVANIYDLNSRTYLIKFSGKDKRLFLMIESGIRFHCTSFMRDRVPSMPNHFCSKLRKYLKSKKLSAIQQCGRDRIVIFTFGVQETHKFYLILELFAGGNIILCDYEHNIVICLRVHQNVKHGDKYPFAKDKNSNVPTDNTQQIQQKLKKCIARLLKQQSDRNQPKKLSNRQKKKQRMNQKMETIKDFIMKSMSASPLIINSIMDKYKIKTNESLLQYVLKPYPILKPDNKPQPDSQQSEQTDSDESDQSDNEPHEDAMYSNMSQEQKINAMLLNSEKFEILMQCFVEYEKLLQSLHSHVCRGFIVSKRISLLPLKKVSIFVKKQRRKQVQPTINLHDDEDHNDQETKDNTAAQQQNKQQEAKFIYDEFIPFQLAADDHLHNDENIRIESWQTFNECVDEFFSSNEAVKSDLKQSRAELLAFKKLETAKGQHTNRIHKLQQEAQQKAFYATVIEENLELVDKAISGVNTLLSQGIDWNDLGNRIREETQFGNPIASIISMLKLHEGSITLKLRHQIEIYPHDTSADAETADSVESDVDSDISDMFADDGPEQKVNLQLEEPQQIKIEHYNISVELRLSAWNNARKYYALKKQLLDKREKTLEATNKAIKAAENKTKVALKEAKQTAQIQKLRKTYWFEKFYWFISCDNFLVIAGRDAQQNELIVKKYMDKQRDVYVHALIHGASSVVIKNPKGLKAIPPRTLNGAGSMCVCRSRAWSNNVSTEAYWVHGYQVSKTPQSGQYLPTGSFVIRGKRNFIQQQPLQMAIVLLFKIDSKSYELNHRNERKMNYFANDGDDGDDDGMLDKNEKSAVGDVTQQFILDDIANAAEDKLKQNGDKSMKKRGKNEENAIYITRTMVHSNARQKKEFEEERRRQNSQTVKKKEESNDIEKNEKKVKQSIRDKKLAKYGFENTKNTKMLSKREKNKRKKRGKYNRMYDESDRKLVQQLLGLQPKDLKNKKKDNDEEIEQKKQEEIKKNEPKEGYELNANPMNLNRNQQANEEHEEEAEEAEEDKYENQRRFALTNRLEDELKLLTGKLYENDTILYCMTMCAPYCTVSNSDDYGFKIKIQPGTTKRGKAVKYVYELFQNMCKSSVLNEALNILSMCKAIKDTEINHIFLSNVKISGAGMKSLQLQHKKQQKKLQKEKWNEKQKQFKKQQKQNKQHNVSANPKKRKKRK